MISNLKRKTKKKAKKENQKILCGSNFPRAERLLNAFCSAVVNVKSSCCLLLDARPTSPTLLDNTGHPAPDHQTQVTTYNVKTEKKLLRRVELNLKNLRNIKYIFYVQKNCLILYLTKKLVETIFNYHKFIILRSETS